MKLEPDDLNWKPGVGLLLRSSIAVVFTPFVEAAGGVVLTGVEDRRPELEYSLLLCVVLVIMPEEEQPQGT